MKTIVRNRYTKDGSIFQTRKLIYKPYPMDDIDLVIGLIVDNLTPNLLTKKYRKENETNPMFGHCYHATQSLFYLMDTDILEQRTAIDYNDSPHWWLVDTTNEKIYDVTADQYYHVGQVPPYADGKKKSWYGWKQRPHQRTLNLMVEVLGKRLALDKIANYPV